VGALTAASEVTMDEVAVWRRALTDDDILAVFRRGAARIGLQVRSCGDAMCSDSVAFLGPDEDPSALFRDDGEVGSAAAIDFLAARRYFQYRVVFETAHVAADPGSPTLRAVSVTGQH
jgi:hypothetical protein